MEDGRWRLWVDLWLWYIEKLWNEPTERYGVIPPAVFTLSKFLAVLKEYLDSSRGIAYCPESYNDNIPDYNLQGASMFN